MPTSTEAFVQFEAPRLTDESALSLRGVINNAYRRGDGDDFMRAVRNTAKQVADGLPADITIERMGSVALDLARQISATATTPLFGEIVAAYDRRFDEEAAA